jgi:hypothetical protein
MAAAAETSRAVPVKRTHKNSSKQDGRKRCRTSTAQRTPWSAPRNDFANTSAFQAHKNLANYVHSQPGLADVQIDNAFVGTNARGLIALWYKPDNGKDGGILEIHNPCESFVTSFLPNMCNRSFGVDYRSDLAVIDCIIWKIKTKAADGSKTDAVKIFNDHFPKDSRQRAEYQKLFAEYLSALHAGFSRDGSTAHRKVLVCGSAAQGFIGDVNSTYNLNLDCCTNIHPEAVFRLLGLKGKTDAVTKDNVRDTLQGVPGAGTCTKSDEGVTRWATAQFGKPVRSVLLST